MIVYNIISQKLLNVNASCYGFHDSIETLIDLNFNHTSFQTY